MSIGIPIKLLHEAQGHIVTIEIKTGEIYRGFLVDSEDNMNCQLTGITYTSRDGVSYQLEHAFIRGSKIRFAILPDMLKNAPMFRKVDPKQPRGRGFGVGGIRGGRTLRRGKITSSKFHFQFKLKKELSKYF